MIACWSAIGLRREAVESAELLFRCALHADEDSTLLALAACPAVDAVGKPAPPAEVEVPDGKVRDARDGKRLLERG